MLRQNDEPTRRGVEYYRVMIDTHYDYLCYGRFLAQAP
jgi:hypothetical protein